MNRSDDESQLVTLTEWSADLNDALRHAGLEVGLIVDVDAILTLAGDAAHAVLRPAAPLTTFIVGYAAGRAAGGGADPATAVAEAVAAARGLIRETAEHETPDSPPTPPAGQ